jgi:hypothetical protein
MENELRNLKLTHMTETELVAYCDHELNPLQHALVEAHVKQCFICERRVELLREENAALSNQVRTAEDVALVDRLMEQMDMSQEPSDVRLTESAREATLQERLIEYLQQMVASLQTSFAEAMRGASTQSKEIWQWQSVDGKLQARATMEKNADLTLHFSTSEADLEGTRLKVRMGQFSHEVTMRRVSEDEIYASVAIPWHQRPRRKADISVESV